MVRLVTKGLCIPHPWKAHYGGEDAHIIDEEQQLIVFSDGVGGYDKEIETQVADYSNALVAKVADECRTGAALKQAIHRAHLAVDIPGAATICVVQKEADDDVLSVANLGDCRVVLFRNGQAYWSSAVQQHSFNCPLQLGHPLHHPCSDTAEVAEFFQLGVQEGDVLLMGTDGLWDNVWVAELEQMLPSCSTTLDDCAVRIAHLAFHHSMDESFISPFAVEAAQHSAGFDRGGKPDDITVLVAIVTSEEGKQDQAEPAAASGLASSCLHVDVEPEQAGPCPVTAAAGCGGCGDPVQPQSGVQPSIVVCSISPYETTSVGGCIANAADFTAGGSPLQERNLNVGAGQAPAKQGLEFVERDHTGCADSQAGDITSMKLNQLQEAQGLQSDLCSLQAAAQLSELLPELTGRGLKDAGVLPAFPQAGLTHSAQLDGKENLPVGVALTPQVVWCPTFVKGGVVLLAWVDLGGAQWLACAQLPDGAYWPVSQNGDAELRWWAPGEPLPILNSAGAQVAGETPGAVLGTESTADVAAGGPAAVTVQEDVASVAAQATDVAGVAEPAALLLEDDINTAAGGSVGILDAMRNVSTTEGITAAEPASVLVENVINLTADLVVMEPRPGRLEVVDTATVSVATPESAASVVEQVVLGAVDTIAAEQLAVAMERDVKSTAAEAVVAHPASADVVPTLSVCMQVTDGSAPEQAVAALKPDGKSAAVVDVAQALATVADTLESSLPLAALMTSAKPSARLLESNLHSDDVVLGASLPLTGNISGPCNPQIRTVCGVSQHGDAAAPPSCEDFELVQQASNAPLDRNAAPVRDAMHTAGGGACTPAQSVAVVCNTRQQEFDGRARRDAGLEWDRLAQQEEELAAWNSAVAAQLLKHASAASDTTQPWFVASNNPQEEVGDSNVSTGPDNVPHAKINERRMTFGDAPQRHGAGSSLLRPSTGSEANVMVCENEGGPVVPEVLLQHVGQIVEYAATAAPVAPEDAACAVETESTVVPGDTCVTVETERVAAFTNKLHAEEEECPALHTSAVGYMHISAQENSGQAFEAGYAAAHKSVHLLDSNAPACQAGAHAEMKKTARHGRNEGIGSEGEATADCLAIQQNSLVETDINHPGAEVLPLAHTEPCSQDFDTAQKLGADCAPVTLCTESKIPNEVPTHAHLRNDFAVIVTSKLVCTNLGEGRGIPGTPQAGAPSTPVDALLAPAALDIAAGLNVMLAAQPAASSMRVEPELLTAVEQNKLSSLVQPATCTAAEQEIFNAVRPGTLDLSAVLDTAVSQCIHSRVESDPLCLAVDAGTHSVAAEIYTAIVGEDTNPDNTASHTKLAWQGMLPAEALSAGDDCDASAATLKQNVMPDGISAPVLAINEKLAAYGLIEGDQPTLLYGGLASSTSPCSPMTIKSGQSPGCSPSRCGQIAAHWGRAAPDCADLGCPSPHSLCFGSWTQDELLSCIMQPA